MIDVAKLSQQRYACGEFDTTKSIPKELMQQLYTVLRNSPSAANAQPWHFIISDKKKTKLRLAEYLPTHSKKRIISCSHFIIFCTKTPITEDHLSNVLSAEEKAKRFTSIEAKERMDEVRHLFIQVNSKSPQHLQAWKEKQLYLAVGGLLLAAAALEIDSVALEGFNHQQVNENFALGEKGLASSIIVTLGYRCTNDANATLAKARLTEKQLFSFI